MADMVQVMAVRNLDLLNSGQITTVERDDQVDRLLEHGYLVEVDNTGHPVTRDRSIAESEAAVPVAVDEDEEAEEPEPIRPLGRRHR